MVFERYHQARDESSELNLIPIMNLMVTLIPFLMLGAAFYHVGVIPATMPTRVESLSPPPSDEVVTLNFELGPKTLVVSASSATVSAEALAALGFTLNVGPDGFDAAALTERLAAIKARYPKSDTVVLLPDASVRYEIIVGVLDAARERSTPGPDGVAQVTPLFPVAVFSLLPEPPPEEPGEAVGSEAPPSAPASAGAP